MTNKENWFNKAAYLLCIATVFFISFTSFLSEVLSFRTSLGAGTIFWLTHWYEPFWLVACVWGVWRFWVNERQATSDKRLAIVLALLLVLWGIAQVMSHSSMLGRSLEGFRFTLFGVLMFCAVYLLPINQLWCKRIRSTYQWTALAIAAWVIVERWLGPNYLIDWGLIAPGSAFGYGAHRVVEVYQNTSVLGGPNQLATYLIPAVFLWLSLLRKETKKWWRWFAVFILLAAIVLTFSRSALIGLLLAIIIWISTVKGVWSRVVPLVSGLGLALGSYWFFARSNYRPSDFLTHGASQKLHADALTQALTELGSRLHEPVALLVGSGLGMAGPAVLKYGDGFVSESWYLQLILEIGLIGLLLWLGLMVALGLKLIEQKRWDLLCSLVAISVAALFLHTWADNPAVTITLFILLGQACSIEKDRAVIGTG